MGRTKADNPDKIEKAFRNLNKIFQIEVIENWDENKTNEILLKLSNKYGIEEFEIKNSLMTEGFSENVEISKIDVDGSK